MSAYASTYRVGADGFGTDARWAATTGRASSDDERGDVMMSTQLMTSGRVSQ